MAAGTTEQKKGGALSNLSEREKMQLAGLGLSFLVPGDGVPAGGDGSGPRRAREGPTAPGGDGSGSDRRGTSP